MAIDFYLMRVDAIIFSYIDSERLFIIFEAIVYSIDNDGKQNIAEVFVNSLNIWSASNPYCDCHFSNGIKFLELFYFDLHEASQTKVVLKLSVKTKMSFSIIRY
jgi:hypothetical protein